MGADLFRKYVSSSMIICYRSVVRHPFLVGMVFLLILMYRLFPLLFSLLVSASPVIVSTAVLLGTLLSYGQPNIPEVEKESKSDRDEIQKLETKVMNHTEIVGRDGSCASVELNGSRIEVGDKSFGEKTSVHDDNSCVEVDTPVGLCENLQSGEEHLVEEAKNEMGDQGIDVDEEKVVLASRYSPLQQSEDENILLESDDKLWEGSADPLNSDSGLLWKRVEGGGDDSEDDEGSDSGSDLAESSSPDASMADIIPLLDELHPLLSEEPETRQPIHTPCDGTDAASEHSLESSDSSSESNDDGGIENHEDLEAGDDEDKESKHTDKEDETRLAITWTEDDQKNLMNLGTSELERNRRLENLIARRRARKTMRMQAEKNLIDLESADLPWNIPPISTARNNPFDISYDSNDNVPGSAPSILLQRRNPFDLPYDSSEEKPDLVGDTFLQEFAAVQPKEPFFRRHESFNVGPSNFGASRSERQETKLRPYFVPERIASDGTSFSSFQRQLSGLSDAKVSSVPDTESVSSAGDLENKDHIEDDRSLEPELISEKEHEHASGIREHLVLTSESEHLEASEHVSDHVSQGIPYFVPEHIASDGTSLSSFHRQISELSDSKVSSVPDTDSISSAGDLENKDPVEDNLSLEPELISVKEHDPKAREHVSEHASQGSESSEDDGNVESIQVEKGDGLDKAEISVGNVTNQQVASDFLETENAASSVELMSDATHLNLGDQEIHSRASSLSSSYEVSDQIYNEKEGDEMPTSVSETDYYFVERGNSIERSDIDITSLLVEESHPKEPIYDSSPRAVTKNLSSSSISTDLQADISERGNDAERTGSVSGRESQETVQKTETDFHGNDAEFVASSEQDAAEEIESRSITDYNLDELDLNLGPSVGEDHLHNDKSFWHAKDQHQTSSSVADVKSNSTDSSPETRDDQNQIPTVPDNEEPLLAGDSISTSLLDMDAYHQLEQVQVPSSNYHERSHEGIHQEEAISQFEEYSLLGRSMDEPSVEDPEELQGHELERGQFASSNSEAQSEEVVHGETHENLFPTHHQFVSEEEEAVSQPQKEFPLLDTSANKQSEENPEVLQVQITSNNLDNLQIQEPENNTSLSINSVLSPEPDVVEVTGFEAKAPENMAYASDIHSIESKNVPDNIDDVDDIKEIDENLLAELDVVGDFSVKDLGSTLNEMKEDQHASEHDLEIKRSANEDSYSKDSGSIFKEMKQDPRALEHDLENNRPGDEDSYSKDLGSTLNEMKQDPHGMDHDIETKRSGDEDSYSKDLGSTLNEMKQDPHASEHDLETKRSGDEDSYSMDLGSISNEMIQDPHALEHDLRSNRSVDEDSYKDFKSTLNEMKQDPRASGHILETFYSVDENAFSKEVESTLNEMKQDPQAQEHDLETNLSDHEDHYSVKTDAEEVMKPQNEKEISNIEVAGASEASRTKSINDANEAELAEKTESSTSWSNSTSATVVNTSNTDKE